MDIVELRDYCLGKQDTTESFPFDDETLVFKVNGRIYALVSLNSELSINLKCDPELAVELREKYNKVIPGYHMNKKHWNTILIDGTIPDSEIYSWIDHSYHLVNKTKKKFY